MPKSKTFSGLAITWGAEHRDGQGNLICRMASIPEPAPLRCIRFGCILGYLHDMLRYSIISLYHQRRQEYAEANRRKRILERYRTGDPSPRTIWQALYALAKLGCPLCRRVDIPAYFEKALGFR
jgi:hypothetical protein